MNNNLRLIFAAALSVCACVVLAQRGPTTAGPVATDKLRTVYIRLGGDEALLYDPVSLGANSHVALMYAHPDGNNFNFLGAPEMAKRGYRVLAVNHHGGGADIEAWGQPLSRGIGYLRTLAGVQRVVAKIGFVFLMVPLASWLLIAVVVPIAALVSRRTG